MVVLLGPVNQHFFLRRLVVGNAFEIDMRHNATDLFALLVLLAFVNEASCRAAQFVVEFVPGERGGEQALPCESERHTAGVNCDPAPAPLLGYVSVVPLPQVGSRTRSPGSVVIKMQRWTISGLVCTTYVGSEAPPKASHQLDRDLKGKSSR